MSPDITVSDLEVMRTAVHYRRWLFSQVAPHVGQRVLEIGAGIGNYTEFLLDRELVVCLDLNAEAVSSLREQFACHPQILTHEGDIADVGIRLLARYGCDTALCFNVLEHVADEAKALENIRHILVPGGRLLLIVPALPSIMGTVDRSLGHYRRYDPSTLRSSLVAIGFRVERTSYMNFPGIFGWLWNNCIRCATEESPAQIRLYDRFVASWWPALERIVSPPIGLSLVCIAYVPGADGKGRD